MRVACDSAERVVRRERRRASLRLRDERADCRDDCRAVYCCAEHCCAEHCCAVYGRAHCCCYDCRAEHRCSEQCGANDSCANHSRADCWALWAFAFGAGGLLLARLPERLPMH